MTTQEKSLLELLARKYINDTRVDSHKLPVEINIPDDVAAKMAVAKKEKPRITLLELQRALDLAG